MDRRDYWNNDYVKYWKQKVEAANLKTADDITKNDCKTSGDKEVYDLFDKLAYKEGDKLLDFGCGYGRFYEYFKNKGQDYYGMDISKAMIDEACLRYPALLGRVCVAEGENLPYDNDVFEKIICYGVFDACYQEKALEEMFRVCKCRGEIVITGKNIEYFNNDDKAKVAEVNARKKGHPNYFTDVAKLKSALEALGVEILVEEYYLRRGDMSLRKYLTSIPEKFYEWRFILKKGKPLVHSFNRFSSDFSKKDAGDSDYGMFII